MNLAQVDHELELPEVLAEALLDTYLAEVCGRLAHFALHGVDIFEKH